MGGHRAGERASALTVVAIEQFTLNTFKWFFGSNDAEAQKVLAQFQAALSQADARILEEGVERCAREPFDRTRSPDTVSATSSRMSSAARSWESGSKPARSKFKLAIAYCCVRMD